MAITTVTKITEHTLSINEFNKPKVLTNEAAIAQKLIEIALLNPGTYPTRPDMGLGLVRKYRYQSDTDVEKMKEEYKSQIETYLPTLTDVEIDIKVVGKELRFFVKIDGTMFRLILNTDTKTLMSL